MRAPCLISQCFQTFVFSLHGELDIELTCFRLGRGTSHVIYFSRTLTWGLVCLPDEHLLEPSCWLRLAFCYGRAKLIGFAKAPSISCLLIRREVGFKAKLNPVAVDLNVGEHLAASFFFFFLVQPSYMEDSSYIWSWCWLEPVIIFSGNVQWINFIEILKGNASLKRTKLVTSCKTRLKGGRDDRR